MIDKAFSRSQLGNVGDSNILAMSVKSIKSAFLFNSVEHLLLSAALIECSIRPRTLTEGL